MKQNQSGSMHVITIIVLVVALVGALGWIFYQNINKLSDSNSDTQPAQKTETKEEVTQAEEKDYLLIKDWGIKFAVGEDIADASYFIENGYVYVSTRKLDALCSSGGMKPSVAAISRGKEGQEYVSSTPDDNRTTYGDGIGQKVGDYYYVHMLGNGVNCSAEADLRYESTLRKAYGKALKQLELI